MDGGLWLYNNRKPAVQVQDGPVLDQNRKKIITYDRMFQQRQQGGGGFLSYLRDRGYLVIGEIGRGGYGVVYKAKNVDDDGRTYAIKINYDTVARSTVYLEVAFFHLMRKRNNVPRLVDFFFVENTPHIVLLYFEHQPFIQLFEEIRSLSEVKHYMIELLKSIYKLKTMGIYHRDIKPMNYLYNSNTRKGIIIDFGLAQVDLDFVQHVVQVKYNDLKSKLPQKQRNYNAAFLELKEEFNLYKRLLKANEDHGVNKVGTQTYVSLQTLIHAQNQGHECQVWSAGVIFLQFLTQKLHFFNQPKFNTDQQEEIKYLSIFVMELAHIYGKQAVEDQLIKYGWKVQFPIDMPEKANLRNMISLKSSNQRQNQIAFDLMTKMLELKPENRIAVQDALWHPFFDEVRKQHFSSTNEKNWYKRQLEKRFPKKNQTQQITKNVSASQVDSSFSKSQSRSKKQQSSSKKYKYDLSSSEEEIDEFEQNRVERYKQRKVSQKERYQIEEPQNKKDKKIESLSQDSIDDSDKILEQQEVQDKIKINQQILIKESVKKNENPKNVPVKIHQEPQIMKTIWKYLPEMKQEKQIKEVKEIKEIKEMNEMNQFKDIKQINQIKQVQHLNVAVEEAKQQQTDVFNKKQKRITIDTLIQLPKPKVQKVIRVKNMKQKVIQEKTKPIKKTAKKSTKSQSKSKNSDQNFYNSKKIRIVRDLKDVDNQMQSEKAQISDIQQISQKSENSPKSQKQEKAQFLKQEEERLKKSHLNPSNNTQNPQTKTRSFSNVGRGSRPNYKD